MWRDRDPAVSLLETEMGFPVIDRHYPLRETADAIRCLEKHMRAGRSLSILKHRSQEEG